MSNPRRPAPEGAGPAEMTGHGAKPSDGALPWPAIAGVAGVLIVIAVIAVALQLRDEPGAGAAPSAPDASVAATAEPSPSDTASAAPSASEAPSPSAEAPVAIPTDWTAMATFSEAGKRYVVGDLRAWHGGQIAVGTLYEDEARGVFGPPPARTGVVWLATDGTDWAVAPVGDAFDGVELERLLVRDDGSLLAVGTSWPGVEPVDVAWVSDDGLYWTAVELAGVPANAKIIDVAHGPRGYVASVAGEGSASLLFSTDGVTWEVTPADVGASDVGAGPEGFVAAVAAAGPEGTTTYGVVASSDGWAWFDAGSPPRGHVLVAPRGGDWLAVATEFGDSFAATAWHSANGLDWTELGHVPLADVSFSAGETITCKETPAELHSVAGIVLLGMTLLGPCSEGGVVAAGGSYASLDGAGWTGLPFGDQATVRGAVAVNGQITAVTDTATNQAPTIGVTFWSSAP